MSYLKYDGSLAAETAAPGPGLYSTSAVETLTGTSAPESLWGGAGDRLVGGAGDDTYYLQGAGIQVVEAVGGGTDKIVAWANTSLTHYSNVENLEIGGDKTYGAGDAQDNIIVATGTNQQLYGGGGQDVLVGGSGADTFIVIKGQGNDALYNFNPTQDAVRLTSGYTSFAQVQSHLTQVGADVKLDMGGGDGLVFRNLSTGQLTAANFQLQLDPAKLGAMTFHDEFSGPLSLYDKESNPTGTWRPDLDLQGSQGYGSYTLAGNNEQQIYTSPYFRDHPGDFSESPFVSNSDGTLSIWAKPSNNSELFGYHYTSGMLSSKESFAQTYGYFEMRAELPHDAGGWPAFWLLPADRSWPPELDVMETLTNDPNADWTTAHTAQSGSHTAAGGTAFIPDSADGFHTYGVLWTPTDLIWYTDGVEVFHTATPADMNKPMYMIANLALGGWGGTIDNSQLPAEMKIDYIRSYALADGSSSGGAITTPPATGGGTSGSTGGSAPVETTPGGATTGQVLTAAAVGSTLVGGAGADTLNASQANDTLTGGAGADHFVFAKEPWSPVHITDFELGKDVLDLSALLKASGYTGADPVADHYVSFQDDGHGGTALCFDRDGTGSNPVWGNYIVDLEHVSPTGLTWAQLSGGSTGGTAGGSTGGTTGGSTSGGSTAGSSPTQPDVSGVVLTAKKVGSVLLGGAGADTLNASQANDTLTGGAGADHFVFAKEPWSPVHITDFQLGKDVLDLSALFKASGYSGKDPVADHYVSFQDDGHGGTALCFDRDGTGSNPVWGNYIVDLEHVSPTGLTWGQLTGVAKDGPSTIPTEPVVPGVVLTSASVGSTLVGGAGSDTLNASQANDTLTGGAGADHFVFAKEPWSPVHITDFELGKDVLDLSALFKASGYTGKDPVADHYVSFQDDGHGGTALCFDSDGTGSNPVWGNYVIDLEHVSPTGLTWAQLQGSGWVV